MTALTVPRAGSQNARILDALQSGRFVSVSEIHRRAGFCRLNSRVSELRSYGYTIEHRYTPRGRRATLDHAYRWADAPGLPPAVTGLPGENVAPRDEAERFRVYACERDQLRLLATCPDEESVGVCICTLGREGEFGSACVGILDTHGTEHGKSEWILNPWEPTTY